MRPRKGIWFEGLRNEEYQLGTYPREHLPALRHYLQMAFEQAETDIQRERVEKFREGFNRWAAELK